MVNLTFAIILGHTFERTEVMEHLADFLFFIETAFFGEIADLVAVVLAVRLAVDDDFAAIGAQDVHYHPDGGGFARAIGSDDANYLSLLGGERQVVHGAECAVGLGDVIQL